MYPNEWWITLVRHGQSGPEIPCDRCMSLMKYEYVTNAHGQALIRGCWNCGACEHVIIQRQGGPPTFPYQIRDFDREWFNGLVSVDQEGCPHVEHRRDQQKPAIHLPGSPAFNKRSAAFKKRRKGDATE